MIPQEQKKKARHLPRKRLVIALFVFSVIWVVVGILSVTGIIKDSWYSISSLVFVFLGGIIAAFQWLFPLPPPGETSRDVSIDQKNPSLIEDKPEVQESQRPISTTQKTKEQWLAEGNTHQEAGQYREAIAAYTQAIALDPKDANIYCKRGNAYYELNGYGQGYEHAIADFDQAISLNPNDTSASYWREQAYYHLRDLRNAWTGLDRALAQTSRLSPQQVNTGQDPQLTAESGSSPVDDRQLESVNKLLQEFRGARSPGNKARAARALGALRSQAASAVPALRVALRDPSVYVRNAAAWALGEIDRGMTTIASFLGHMFCLCIFSI